MRGKEPIKQQNFDTSGTLRTIPTVNLFVVFNPSTKTQGTFIRPTKPETFDNNLLGRAGGLPGRFV